MKALLTAATTAALLVATPAATQEHREEIDSYDTPTPAVKSITEELPIALIAHMSCEQLMTGMFTSIKRQDELRGEIAEAIGAKTGAAAVGMVIPGAGLLGAAFNGPWEEWRFEALRFKLLLLSHLREC